MPKEPKLDVESKLNALNKKSVYERQKAEAEAKRLKEQRETAAVYEDFVKSFDDEGSDDDAFPPSRPSQARGAFAGSSGTSRRHFSTQQGGPQRPFKISGPGTLGPAPPSFGRKRTHEGSPPNHGLRAFDPDSEDRSAKAAFKTSDDEHEDSQSRVDDRAAQKPTIHMSSLPPGMSIAGIKSIIPASVTAENVRILSSPNVVNERRSMSAIVTLASETPASELDAVVSQLQNRYLGHGYYLSLSRHLSSAVFSSTLPTGPSPSLPFGAKAAAPPPGSNFTPMQTRGGRGGIAPPPSLIHGASGVGRGAPPVRVAVVPPSDLKQLKLIHKMIELVTTHGPEFEALLMSRPEVQKDERWAWLWDPSSIGGIWYRWRMWEIATDKGRRDRSIGRRVGSSMRHLFDRNAPWVLEEPDLPFEYAVELREFVSDPDYGSTDDEDSGDEGRQRLQQLHGQSGPGVSTNIGAEEASYLNPLRKAKLMHLLSRVPNTNARLRRGDVARVTAFAIQNAGEGAEEVVDLLTANILEPFTLRYNTRSESDDADEMKTDTAEEAKAVNSEEADPAAAKLVALYLTSDILSSSSTSGVRHAWRYRQLFENALRRKRIFEHLGRLEKQLKWGRIRAEKWRRAVTGMLHLWEGWSVFTAASQEEFVELFNSPPLTVAEQAAAEQAEKEQKKTDLAASRWKTITDQAEKQDTEANASPMGDKMDVDEDVDGSPMEEDEDGDLDGVPMEDSDEEVNQVNDMQEKAQPEEPSKAEESERPVDAPIASDPGASGRKGRPKAVDMFGDSDDDQ